MQVFESPDTYIGRRVVWGGEIVKTHNIPGGAEIEIIQKNLDSTGEPYGGDQTAGRFIFFKKGYLESEVFSKGRKVTGAGVITGSQVRRVEDQEYRFPVIEVEELHLWEEVPAVYYDPFYWDPFWYPYPYRYRYFRRPYWGYPYYW